MCHLMAQLVVVATMAMVALLLQVQVQVVAVTLQVHAQGATGRAARKVVQVPLMVPLMQSAMLTLGVQVAPAPCSWGHHPRLCSIAVIMSGGITNPLSLSIEVFADSDRLPSS